MAMLNNHRVANIICANSFYPMPHESHEHFSVKSTRVCATPSKAGRAQNGSAGIPTGTIG